MARKIKFPLEMAEGNKVRNIEDLRENFDLNKIINYMMKGQLVKWLNDRNYDDEAEQISNIDINSDNALEDICNVFGVEAQKYISDIEILKKRRKKITELKNFIKDDELLKCIDCIAFDEKELLLLLEKKLPIIYLFKNSFKMPLNVEKIKFIGINEPTVIIESEKIINFAEKKVYFENVKFNTKYNELMKLSEEKKVVNSKVSSDYMIYDALNKAIKEVFRCL